jgi:hypothetical protein
VASSWCQLAALLGVFLRVGLGSSRQKGGVGGKERPGRRGKAGKHAWQRRWDAPAKADSPIARRLFSGSCAPTSSCQLVQGVQTLDYFSTLTKTRNVDEALCHGTRHTHRQLGIFYLGLIKRPRLHLLQSTSQFYSTKETTPAQVLNQSFCAKPDRSFMWLYLPNYVLAVSSLYFLRSAATVFAHGFAQSPATAVQTRVGRLRRPCSRRRLPWAACVPSKAPS